MKVLAIDPGPEQSAYVVYAPETRTVLDHHKLPNGALAEMLENEAIADQLVIERVSCFGMRVGREVFRTCEWIGFFARSWLGYHADLDYIERPAVKQHLCGKRAAKDADVRARLIDIFGPGKAKAIGVKATPGPLYGITKDRWSALALAVTWADLHAPKGPQLELEARPGGRLGVMVTT